MEIFNPHPVGATLLWVPPSPKGAAPKPAGRIPPCAKCRGGGAGGAGKGPGGVDADAAGEAVKYSQRTFRGHAFMVRYDGGGGDGGGGEGIGVGALLGPFVAGGDDGERGWVRSGTARDREGVLRNFTRVHLPRVPWPPPPPPPPPPPQQQQRHAEQRQHVQQGAPQEEDRPARASQECAGFGGDEGDEGDEGGAGSTGGGSTLGRSEEL